MSLRIGALAALSGFSRDTIRYYERLGLIGKPARTDAGGAPCAEVRQAAERRLDQVEAQLRELARLRSGMRQTLRLWNDRLAAAPIGAPAHLLEDDIALPEPRKRALGARH